MFGAGWRPVRAEADADSLLPCYWDGGGLAVEPQIGERRPCDGAGRLPACEDSRVNGVGMYRDETWLEATGSLGITELTSHKAAALTLRAVVDECRAGSHLVGPFGQRGRLRREDRGVDQIGVVGPERLVLDVANKPTVAWPVLRRRSLDCRSTTDDGLGFDVSQQFLRTGGDQRVRGPGGACCVALGSRPGVVMQEGRLLVGLGPERQRVVRQMVVQIDQTRHHQ